MTRSRTDWRKDDTTSSSVRSSSLVVRRWSFATFTCERLATNSQRLFYATNAGSGGTGVGNRLRKPQLGSRLSSCRSTARHFRLIENRIGAEMCWPGSQHLFLAIHQVGCIERRDFEAVPMCNCIGWASFYTVPAKNTAVVIDVINF